MESKPKVIDFVYCDFCGRVLNKDDKDNYYKISISDGNYSYINTSYNSTCCKRCYNDIFQVKNVNALTIDHHLLFVDPRIKNALRRHFGYYPYLYEILELFKDGSIYHLRNLGITSIQKLYRILKMYYPNMIIDKELKDILKIEE